MMTDTELATALYLALDRLHSAVFGNVPDWQGVPDLAAAMSEAEDALSLTEPPTAIQLWQHATSGEVYAVEVSLTDGYVQHAAGPLHYPDLAAAVAGNINWGEEGLAEDIHAQRDAYRLKEYTP